RSTEFNFITSPKNTTNRQTGQEVFIFEEHTLLKLKTFCKQYKTTPFLFFTSILSVLIYHYWRQKQITIGYPTNIRPIGYQKSLGF
ncbi:hypothetical protein ABTK20_21360, partial [Acinetobacter baumannii]